jgi:hypothetical protein
MARTKQTPRIVDMPPLRKKRQEPKGRGVDSSPMSRESPRLKTAKHTSRVVKVLKQSKKKLPTTGRRPPSNKAKSRGKALAAVVAKEQEAHFPQPTSVDSKGTHFSVFDDECICTAYCKVSEDEVKGANRGGVDFWATVGTLANTLMAEGGRSTRAHDSIMNRFQKKIQPMVLSFKASHKLAMKKEESGWNAEMYEGLALELWEGDEGKPYAFIECSRILKAVPKYDWEAEEEVDPEAETTIATGGPMGGNMNRTVGTKKAKAMKAKARRKDASSIDTTLESIALLEEMRMIRERNSKYQDFNMLMRLGRKDEAALLFESLDKGNPVPVSIPMEAASPSSVQESTCTPVSRGQPKDERDYDSDSGSDESSGGDRAAANLRAAKNRTKV